MDEDLRIRLNDGGAEYDMHGMHQRASMSKCTDEELLNIELGIVIHDPVFEQALNRITA